MINGKRSRVVVFALAVMLTATACATGRAVRSADQAARRGDWDTAVAYYREALSKQPNNVQLRIALGRATRAASEAHQARARELEAQDQLAGAMAEYRLAADLDPTNTAAMNKAFELDRKIRQQVEAGRAPSRLELMQQQAAAQSTIPRLDPRVRVPLLQFPSAAIRDILTTISTLTGINITYDRDAQAAVGQAYSVNLVNVPVEEALHQILSNNQLTFKITNPTTIFVYQDVPQKRALFDDVYAQTFYISHGDVADILQIINQMITTGGTAVRPSVTQNKGLNAIVVKATLPVLEAIGAVIKQNDKPRAEVVVETEILEVNRNRVRELGLDLSQYALGFTFSPELAPPNVGGVPGAFPGMPPPFNANTITRGVSPADFYITTPAALVRFLEQDSTTKVLAKSQLRGREGDTLTVRLGEVIPLPQGTSYQTLPGGASQPVVNVQYTPVGLNLNFVPRVTFDDEVILQNLNLQNTGLGTSLDLGGGQVYPTLVERTATTALRLRDGESNLLAGLLLDQERTTLKGFPGISEIPILKHLFGVSDSEAQQTDIVMIITPRILRGHDLRPEDLAPTFVGTSQNFGLGRVPSLIAPGTPPPPATLPLTGQPAPAAPVPTGGRGGGAGAPPAAPASQPGVTAAPPPALVGVVPVPPPGTPPVTVPASATPPAGSVPPANISVPPPDPAPAAGATQVIVTVGGEQQAGGPPFTVPLSISNATEMNAITVSLTFDPKVLQIVGVSPGVFMQQGGVSPTFVPRMDNQAGRLDIAIARPTSTGASGSGTLAGVQFRAIAGGSVQISVSAVATTAAGQPVRVQSVPAAVIVR